MPEYCVTGGTGFIAAYLVKSLLEKGHTVRITVRNPGNVQKVGFLQEFDGARERLKIFKADLLEEGSFDEAVQGVDGVFHTAAPVLVPYSDRIQARFLEQFETLIDPCIKGTQNVLNSCLKASSVKRVVFTSSSSTVRYRDDLPQIFSLNESHWSDIEYCKRHNVSRFLALLNFFMYHLTNTCTLSSARWKNLTILLVLQLWYAYAKTVAEKEAWRISKENGIDLVSFIPSFVVGPLLAPEPSSTLLLIQSIVKGSRGEYPNMAVGFTHVDDVVAGNILAMENRIATGRLVCSGPVAHWSQIIKMLRAKYPSYPYENKCSSQEGDNIPHSMDTTKIARLGLPPFKTLEQMFDDCIRSLQEKGFL
ncbi:hypothetical protein DKX38_015746 [Salix brachista]|uniref:NAD-dependent epimerase/dehydratase domain-containing protein n=1 Tax=Salix brachista TaxID=2182728 RepID=A0A5N5L632_9ROSI|nr:hypothetical protein DKX38_015746 [Salix brachista]